LKQEFCIDAKLEPTEFFTGQNSQQFCLETSIQSAKHFQNQKSYEVSVNRTWNVRTAKSKSSHSMQSSKWYNLQDVPLPKYYMRSTFPEDVTIVTMHGG